MINRLFRIAKNIKKGNWVSLNDFIDQKLDRMHVYDDNTQWPVESVYLKWPFGNRMKVITFDPWLNWFDIWAETGDPLEERTNLIQELMEDSPCILLDKLGNVEFKTILVGSVEMKDKGKGHFWDWVEKRLVPKLGGNISVYIYDTVVSKGFEQKLLTKALAALPGEDGWRFNLDPITRKPLNFYYFVQSSRLNPRGEKHG